jgi:hypothetical protein
VQGRRAAVDTSGMTTSALSILPLLARLAVPLDDAATLPAHAGASGEAWVVVHAGSAWVCWTADAEPDACFRRVELEPPPSAAFLPEEERERELALPVASSAHDPALAIDLRFGFESGRLWIALDELGVWVIEAGQTQARWLDTPASAITLVRPTTPRCGPTGSVPGLVGGRIEWLAAPRCPSRAVPSGCLRPRPRVRKPSGLSLALGLSLAHAREWTLAPGPPDLGLPAHLHRAEGVELALVLAIGFDPAAAWRLARARDELLARDRRRSVPTVDDHPLATDERAALRSIACAEVVR